MAACDPLVILKHCGHLLALDCLLREPNIHSQQDPITHLDVAVAVDSSTATTIYISMGWEHRFIPVAIVGSAVAAAIVDPPLYHPPVEECHQRWHEQGRSKHRNTNKQKEKTKHITKILRVPRFICRARLDFMPRLQHQRKQMNHSHCEGSAHYTRE